MPPRRSGVDIGSASSLPSNPPVPLVDRSETRAQRLLQQPRGFEGLGTVAKPFDPYRLPFPKRHYVPEAPMDTGSARPSLHLSAHAIDGDGRFDSHRRECPTRGLLDHTGHHPHRHRPETGEGCRSRCVRVPGVCSPLWAWRVRAEDVSGCAPLRVPSHREAGARRTSRTNTDRMVSGQSEPGRARWGAARLLLGDCYLPAAGRLDLCGGTPPTDR